MACVVRTCKNVRRLLPGGLVSFFRFPSDNNRFNEWLSIIGETEETITRTRKTMFLCSDHFVPEDIVILKHKKVLKKDAKPRVNPSRARIRRQLFMEPSTSAAVSKKRKMHPSSTDTASEQDDLKQLAPMRKARKQHLSSTDTASDPEHLESMESSSESGLSENKISSTEMASSNGDTERKETQITGTAISSESDSSDVKKTERRVHFLGPITRSMSQQSSKSGSAKGNKNSSVPSSSGSETSGVKRQRIKLEHSYVTTPRTAKRKTEQIKHKLRVQSNKLYKARASIKTLKKRVTSLTDIISDLRSNHSLSTNALEHLQQTYGDVPGTLLQRMLQTQSGSLPRTKYPEELRKFAFTLHFYSGKAYDYVRETFRLSLPHPSVIRKWSATIECQPGFSGVCFQALKIKSEEAKALGKKVICSLMLDEMSIKKQIDYDGGRYWGYVDCGMDLQNSEVEPASEALVLMVVSQNAGWKLPIAYFLIKSISGAEKANIIKEALTRLEEVNIDITSCTCDGPSAHFSMFRELDCNFTVGNMQTFFLHPTTKRRVYAVFDICHMLKLLRNCFADIKIFINSAGQEIRWTYVEQLHKVQEEETLHLANKLRKSHMEWRRQKMRVKLAAQTLSNSVAEAIAFLWFDLKHPTFKGCEATIEFIKRIDKLFDILNSRLPWVKGFKGPLRVENEHDWRPFLLDTMDFFVNLKDVHGQYLWQTPKKTCFLGFMISIQSVIGIFDDFVKRNKLSYFLTYKVSQDHLELFFCAVRSRNGWNNNPSALQFMRTFRKLILHANVSGRGGNCRVLDTTSVLTVSSDNSRSSTMNEIDISVMRKNNVSQEEYLADVEYDVIPEVISLTELSRNVVTYIGGYLIKMLMRTLRCEECIDLLIADDAEDNRYIFIKRRNLGAYVYPSIAVVKIAEATELFIRKLMYVTDNTLPSQQLLNNIVHSVSRTLLGKQVFKNHFEHHLHLLKNVIHCYCKIRLHNLARKFTENIRGDLVRKTYSNLILFKHQ